MAISSGDAAAAGDDGLRITDNDDATDNDADEEDRGCCKSSDAGNLPGSRQGVAQRMQDAPRRDGLSVLCRCSSSSSSSSRRQRDSHRSCASRVIPSEQSVSPDGRRKFGTSPESAPKTDRCEGSRHVVLSAASHARERRRVPWRRSYCWRHPSCGDRVRLEKSAVACLDLRTASGARLCPRRQGSLVPGTRWRRYSTAPGSSLAGVGDSAWKTLHSCPGLRRAAWRFPLNDRSGFARSPRSLQALPNQSARSGQVARPCPWTEYVGLDCFVCMASTSAIIRVAFRVIVSRCDLSPRRLQRFGLMYVEVAIGDWRLTTDD